MDERDWHVEPAATHSKVATDVRCLCGNLLVRRVPEGFEIKCRRCKRAMLLRLTEPERK